MGASITMSGRKDLFGGLAGDAVYVGPLWGGVLSVGGTYEDAGNVTLNASDGTLRRVDARRDLLGLAGYSGELGFDVASGFSVRILRSELVEEFRATTVMFDGGMQIKVNDFIKAGVALRNFGTKTKYFEDEISPSPSARVGAAFGCLLRDFLPFMRDSMDAVLLAADVDYRLVEQQVFLLGGLEYRWNNILYLRAGGSLGSVQRLGSLSLGLGINIGGGESAWVRRYRLDYSIRLLTLGFDAPQMLGMTFIF